MRNLPAFLFAAGLLATPACGSDGATCPHEEDGPACWHLKDGEICDPLWPKTCASERCLKGLIEGTFRPGYQHIAGSGWSPETTICAHSCATDAECSSQSFGHANRAVYEIQTEDWTCKTIPEGEFCSVITTAPLGVPTPDPCDACSPPNCGGECAVCPECS